MKNFSILAALLAAVTIIFSAASVHADGITVLVNGEQIQTPSPAVIVNDRTLVPLRAISESMGFDIDWDEATRGITITDGNVLFFTWIDHDHAFMTSSMALEGYVIMEAAPVIMNDYTMVPLRAISEMFGAEVDWNGSTSTVTVNFEDPVQAPVGLSSKFRTYEQVFFQKYDAYAGFADGTGNVINGEIQLENGGNIEFILFPDIAPITVDNFVNLAKKGFYDGLIFHRVIEGFMIQGGGFDTNYERKESEPIVGEFMANGHFNLISHTAGVMSMARTAASMDSGSSQFFIMHQPSKSLDGQYAAFGYVKNGMEYVNQIAETATEYNEKIGDNDVPVEQQVIKTIIIK